MKRSYPVDIILDKPPVVAIQEPVDQRETLILRAKPVIGFDAAMITAFPSLTINYQVVPPIVPGEENKPRSAPETKRIDLKIKSTEEGHHYEYTLDISAQTPPWKEGVNVNYWIEAADNNTATGPSITRTEPKQFGIVTPEAKQARNFSNASNKMAPRLRIFPIPGQGGKRCRTSHPPIAAVLKIIDNRLGLSKILW